MTPDKKAGEVKLKPCPFCGGEAVVCGCRPEFYVECMGECKLQIPSGDHTFFTSKEAAIQRWNRRSKDA